MFQLRWGSGLFILYDFRLLDLRLFFLISAFQLFSVSAFTSLPLRELLCLFLFHVHWHPFAVQSLLQTDLWDKGPCLRESASSFSSPMTIDR